MKLLKKLLPITTVSAAVATITPFATSCGSKIIDYDFIADGSGIYIPTIPRVVVDHQRHPLPFDNEEAEKIYYENIASNPEIFYQDINASISNIAYHFKTMDPERAEIELGCSLSNLVVDTTKRIVSFSGKCKFHGRYFHLPVAEYVNQLDGDIQIEFEFSAVPYIMMYGRQVKPTLFSGWLFLPNIYHVNQDDNFKMKFSVNGELWSDAGPRWLCKFNNEELTIDDYEDLKKLDTKWTMCSQIYLMFTCVSGSYHLANLESDVDTNK